MNKNASKITTKEPFTSKMQDINQKYSFKSNLTKKRRRCNKKSKQPGGI